MNFLNKIVKNRKVLFNWLLKITIDVVLFNFATLFSVLLRFDFLLKKNYLHIDDPFGLIENIVFIFFELILGIPKQVWRYISEEELKELILLATFTKAVAGFFLYIFKGEMKWSRGAFLISYILLLLFLFVTRFLFKVITNKQDGAYGKSDNLKKKVLIVGAGDAGEKILREILSRPDLNYEVVGFLDDDTNKKAGRIHGIPILGEIARLPVVVNSNSVDTIIIAIPSAPKSVIRRIVSLSAKTNAEIKTLPGLWEIIDGKITLESVRNVKLEDLLPRAPIKTDMKLIKEYIKGKTVLVTGAGGSIGSEIVRQVVRFSPKTVLLLGRGENRIFRIEQEVVNGQKFFDEIPLICDIRNRKKLLKIFEKYRPDIVFHAAAHKHVPLMEKNPDEAVINNIFGTKNLLDASVKFGVQKFINISTDKAVNPVNIMGASKRVIEIMVQLYAKKHPEVVFTSVRFGNVLGSAGSVVEVFKKQIEETGILTVTDKRMKRYFMLIPEAVQLVLHAGALGKGGEIFVLKMGEQVNIYELALNYVKLSGLEIDRDVKIKIIGNRGGEKLYEELWSEREIVEPTENSFILRIRSNGKVMKDSYFFNEMDKLKLAAENLDFSNIREIFMEMVPEAKL